MSQFLSTKDVAQLVPAPVQSVTPGGRHRAAVITAGFHLCRHVETALSAVRTLSAVEPVIHLYGNRATLTQELAGVAALFGEGEPVGQSSPYRPLRLAHNVYLSESTLFAVDAPSDVMRFYTSLTARGGVLLYASLLLPEDMVESTVLEPLRAAGGMMPHLKIGATLLTPA